MMNLSNNKEEGSLTGCALLFTEFLSRFTGFRHGRNTELEEEYLPKDMDKDQSRALINLNKLNVITNRLIDTEPECPAFEELKRQKLKLLTFLRSDIEAFKHSDDKEIKDFGKKLDSMLSRTKPS